MKRTQRTAKKTKRTKKQPKRLTREELHRFGKAHPVPLSFWEGDDDPSKPMK